jgi:hypothetical protein
MARLGKTAAATARLRAEMRRSVTIITPCHPLADFAGILAENLQGMVNALFALFSHEPVATRDSNGLQPFGNS